MENCQIIDREENSMARTIKEAMYIRVSNPTLNRNIRKYNFPTHLGQSSVYHPRTQNQ